MTTFAFYGAGNMGEALLSGLRNSGVSGADILVVEKRPERATEIASAYEVRIVDALTAASEAAVHVLVVKPQDVAGLLGEIGADITSGSLVISIAAGISTAFLESQVGEGVACVRAMPNTPALLGQGMTGVSAGAHCDGDSLGKAASIMSTVGSVVIIAEADQDALTAISGSGPAYVFYLAEAMVEAGLGLGLNPQLARALVNQTLVGASAMLNSTELEPSELRSRVTSPNGTTAAAVAVFDERGTRETVIRAVAAAAQRSRELSSGS